MRTVLIIIGVIAFIVFIAFLWLLMMGSDESQRRDKKSKEQ